MLGEFVNECNEVGLHHHDLVSLTIDPIKTVLAPNSCTSYLHPHDRVGKMKKNNSSRLNRDMTPRSLCIHEPSFK